MSDDPGADEVIPAEVIPAEVLPAEVLPADVTAADIVAGEAANQPAPPDVTISSPGSAGLSPAVPLDTGYTPGGVPTFDYAREKIETRYGTAIGAAELAAETPEGRSVEEQYAARQKAAADRLAQIRESMRGDAPDNV
jgi:hypothetical protein